jgi:dienelactone hydrolase
MQSLRLAVMLFAVSCLGVRTALGQTYGSPDRDQPGDKMIQEYLRREAEAIHNKFLQNVRSLEDWQRLRETYKQEYLYMLGLWPTPEKTPLKATVTGTLEGDGYVVDMLHYQSMPRLYVTANLYRPWRIDKTQRLPAVLYVCGHSGQGRNGNKTAFQSHGIWFARHGYICLMLDTLQLGEIAAIHHGTYREGRWWWHCRGYTPAGVECLNGIRGIDYLIGRPDVDPERIAVTGISGGGAATFWIAAADERVKVAVPVSGMADLPSYVSNRVINGHCDCMFLYNTFQWPWTQIAALVAPRALLFVNSDQDAIFPMDANQRVINRLEQLYSLYGAGDFVDSVVSIGGHAYRRDIRQAAYRFINTHLKDDPGVINDSEVDLVAGSGSNREHPISPEKLRVFPEDSDIPKDELNTTIDRHFVPLAQVELPKVDPAGQGPKGEYEVWKASILAELRRVTFRYFPERIPPARLLRQDEREGRWLESEPGIEVYLRRAAEIEPGSPFSPRLSAGVPRPVDGAKNGTQRIVMIVLNPDISESLSDYMRSLCEPTDCVYVCAPRGVNETRWTRKNPPNYVERSHVLLGRTVDTGRVWDVVAAARYLRAECDEDIPIYVFGEGPAGVLATYAALWETEIAGVTAVKPPLSHMDSAAPQFLNVLRVCDIPDVFGMLAPRPLAIHGCSGDALKKVAQIYSSAGYPQCRPSFF